jgi:hypothetical protein
LGELFGKAVVFVVCGVEVGFCPFGADTQRVARLFQCGDARVGGGGELVECVLVVGAPLTLAFHGGSAAERRA